jgi:hypothetical protein
VAPAPPVLPVAAAPPNPPKPPVAAFEAVARIELAVSEPSVAFVPWRTTASPGWIAVTALVAVRITVADEAGVTLIVVPELSVT